MTQHTSPFWSWTSSHVLVQDLVDVHIFAEAHAILEGLARQDCSAALQWCAQHRARLRKIRSKLEFRLRIQVGTVPDRLASN